MRQKTLWIVAGCVLAVLGLRPASSFGEAPAGYKIIYTFTGGSDGGVPFSDLTVDAAGNLYGTTSGGGTGRGGTVFELHRTKDGWKEEVLYNFGSVQGDGGYPQGGVIFDKAGDLYGTTATGGSSGNNTGTVFKLSRNSNGRWTEKILYSFTGENGDGQNPQVDLTFDAHGNLYGAAPLGGDSHEACIGLFSAGCGIVFELMPHPDGSWTEATIYAFTGVPDGAIPSSPVVLDALGNVYGLTEAGGAGICLNAVLRGCGLAYELTPGSGGKWTESITYEFKRGGGFAINPSGGLLFNNAGNLLGTALKGGNGLGAVFELERSQKGWNETVLYRFYANLGGGYPVGQLTTDEKGDLFGVASLGGANGSNGLVFELVPGRTPGWTERILHGFRGGSDGFSPTAGLVSDSQGHLYGTTREGGNGTGCDQGCGVVYEVTP